MCGGLGECAMCDVRMLRGVSFYLLMCLPSVFGGVTYSTSLFPPVAVKASSKVGRIMGSDWVRCKCVRQNVYFETLASFAHITQTKHWLSVWKRARRDNIYGQSGAHHAVRVYINSICMYGILPRRSVDGLRDTHSTYWLVVCISAPTSHPLYIV